MRNAGLIRPGFSHMPALDGLRGSAILIVLVAHFGFYKIVPGGFGVTLFFFISGFLITRLLLAEFEQAGQISIRRFYIRRLLRLYPALVFAVFASYLCYAILAGYVIWPDIVAALLYASNYYGLSVGFGSAYPQEVASLVHIGVLWSLAVEEQYYMLFPLLFALAMPRMKRFIWILSIAALGCLLLRIYLAGEGGMSERIYAGTDTRLDSILYGAILTALLAGKSAERWLAFFSSPTVFGISLLMLLASFVWRDQFFRDTFRYSLQGLALMSIVCTVCFSDWLSALRRVFESAPMCLLGTWSYSLYLFHQLALTFAELATGESYLSGVGELSLQWYAIAVISTFVMAASSYHFVERPFLSLRHRFGSKSQN